MKTKLYILIILLLIFSANVVDAGYWYPAAGKLRPTYNLGLRIPSLASCSGGLVTNASGIFACGDLGGADFGQAWEINLAGFLVPTSTITTILNNGFISQASSTFSAPVFGPDPTVGTHLATKDYVDNAIDTRIDFFFTDTASDIVDLGINVYLMADIPTGLGESTVSSSTLKTSPEVVLPNSR